MPKLKLSKYEAGRLLELLDVITNRCPQLRIDEFTNSTDNATFWDLYKRLYPLAK